MTNFRGSAEISNCSAFDAQRPPDLVQPVFEDQPAPNIDWSNGEKAMPVIAALVLFAIFWVVSPKLFKWLFTLNLVLSIGGYALLRIVASFFGATRGGRNSGIFEKEALVIGLSFYGMAAIVALGIISGGVMGFCRSRSSGAKGGAVTAGQRGEARHGGQ